MSILLSPAIHWDAFPSDYDKSRDMCEYEIGYRSSSNNFKMEIEI